VLVLLPPSEGKTPGGDGPRLRLSALSWPSTLGSTRSRIVKRLVELCRGDPTNAREVLGLSERLDADRVAGSRIRSSPTLPAGLRYSGVLYDALGYASLAAPARERADATLVTFSGLWGAVRPADPIPAYRLGITTRLPGEPAIPAIWRDPVGRALSRQIAAEGAIDLRSTGYAEMARLTPRARANLTVIKVVAPSFASKQIKGILARRVLAEGAVTVDGFLAAAKEVGLRCDPSSGREHTVSMPTGWLPPG